MNSPGPIWGCSRCGGTFPAGTAQCPHCGQQFAVSGVGASVATPAKSRAALYGAMAAFAGVLAMLAVLYATGVLRLTTKQPGPKLAVQQDLTPTRAVFKGFEPDLAAPTDATQMPEEVRKWLEHLQECENRRKKLSTGGLTRVMGLFYSITKAQLGSASEEGSATPADTFTDSVGPMKEDWDGLATFFRSVPPPAECKPIADTYDPVIIRTGERMIEIVGMVEQAYQPGADPQALADKLTAEQGDSTKTIDTPAKETDRQVQEICDKYKTTKWFSIADDFSSPLTGLMGGGLFR